MGKISASMKRLGEDKYASHIGARLVDFFNHNSPWQRRLWDVGTCMLLDEVIEAVNWRARNVLSDSALNWLAKDAQRIIGRDPAAGDRRIKKQLEHTLRTALTPGSREVRSLIEFSSLLQHEYLHRWLVLVESKSTPPSPERLTRAVASHLLDLGYSMPFLFRWAKSHIKDRSSLAELLISASDLARDEPREYEVMIPFVSVPGANTHLTSGDPAWRSGPEVKEWLEHCAGNPRAVRQSGGFLYRFHARDAVSAAYKGAHNIERIISRSTLARSKILRPEPEGRIWIKGSSSPIHIPDRTRNALVRSLEAESLLYNLQKPTDLDDALELLGAMNSGSLGPAIASGWAAVESLLISPTDATDLRDGRGVVAAQRAAQIVTCSWPRAELTTLSYKHRPSQSNALSTALEVVSSNRERSRKVANALSVGEHLALRGDSDSAAEARMKKLLESPRETLRDVEAHLITAMRRLYRQRNVVMHGGSTTTLTMEATLRTCAPLVGAALDRITHARLTHEVDALQLASRAQFNLELLASTQPVHIVDLLEPLS